MRYVHYDIFSGKLLGFYNSKIHKYIPEPKIAIEEEKYFRIIDELNDSESLYNFKVIDNTIQKVPKPIDLDEEKDKKISEVKKVAHKLLTELDWKSLRHKDEKDMNIETSLTEEEYQNLLIQKKAIRDKSNQLETQILNLTSIVDLRLINVFIELEGV